MTEARDIKSILEQAIALHQQGQPQHAEILYREVLGIMPEEPNAWHLLGAIAFQRGDLATGEEYIRKAIQFHPKAPTYYVNLGNLLKQKGDFSGAVEQYEKAYRLSPKDDALRRKLAETSHHLGARHMEEQNLEEAKAAYRRTLELDPGNVSTLNNLAMIRQHECHYDDAQKNYGEALKNDPKNIAVRYNRSICSLVEGKLDEGWADLAATDAHWLPMHDERKNLPWLKCKLWDGSDLKGKKILVWGDQGIGDEILYASMVPDLIARGALVTIECMDRLVPIFTRSFPEVKIVARQNPPLPDDNFDFHAPGLWLGRWLRPDFESFPTRHSYLKADPEKIQRLRKRYQDMGRKRIIGLSWFTKSPAWGLKRSLQLADMLAPLDLKDMLIVDLQYGDTAQAWEEAQKLFPDLKVCRDPEVDQLKDMDVYAAQVAACDYIVTIGNTTSHIAGALGVPASILTPAEGLTWYWFAKGENSPWYPSLKLLRHAVPDRLRLAATEAART